MARSDYFAADGGFMGGACSCCGTWVRVKPVFLGELLYGKGCSEQVKNLKWLLKSIERPAIRDLGAEVLAIRIKSPKRYTHVRTLLGLADSDILAIIQATQAKRI